MSGDAKSKSKGFPTHLVKGYEAFLAGRFSAERDRFETLAREGQKPRTMIIGCCDSRVAPEAIFDAGPGDLFVLRNVAALVPPYQPDDHYHGASAALEYAIMALEVEHIVVLGHAQCGGVRAYAQSLAHPDTQPLTEGDFIGDWIKMLAPAHQKLGVAPEPDNATYMSKLELETIRLTLRHLRGFPMVQILERRGYLKLHGAYFGVMDGRLLVLDEARNEFLPVSESPRAAAFAEARF